MPTILDGVDALVELLAGTGARVTADPRDVNPPCLYVTPPLTRWRYQTGDYDADWTVYALGMDGARREALAQIDELVALVRRVCPVVEARPDTLAQPDGGPPLPAYVFTWTTRIRGKDQP